ncbi:MAG: hypothetical protein K9G62_05255 [Alphaproteobacteria bacterium]|nr:hypothetical protein [Alphaproteobacteria bacterium]
MIDQHDLSAAILFKRLEQPTSALSRNPSGLLNQVDKILVNTAPDDRLVSDIGDLLRKNHLPAAGPTARNKMFKWLYTHEV